MDVYEAIATLEYLGRPPTRSEIGAAAGVDGAALDELLTSLTSVTCWSARKSRRAAFEPARRGCSAVPDEAAGPQRLS